MDQIVISLLSPVPEGHLDDWVVEEVDRLRGEGLAIGVRLGPLRRSTPAEGGDWLIELHRHVDDVPLEEDVALASILTELAILSLRPCLFVISAPLAPLAALAPDDEIRLVQELADTWLREGEESVSSRR